MKKILLSLVTMLVALAGNAQTTLDFTNATTWGYENAEAGNFTQVNRGDVLQQGNFKITVDFLADTEDKTYNGARFFTHSTTGAINLRLYVGTTIKIETVDGSNMTAVEISGSNLGSSYVTDFDGYTNGTWKGSANSITMEIKKSTVQINTMKIYTEGGAAPADISNTPETAYTVSKAFELIDAGEGLSTKVYVKGTIAEVKELSVEYGNATYTITDGSKTLTVYRGYSLKGEKFTNDGDINDGDEVIVYGQLVNYQGTYEFTQGSQIYSLNGKTEPEGSGEIDPEVPYSIVGAGTLDNPYTTEDVIKGVYKEDATVAGVWVKGTILGCFNSAAKPLDETKDPVASNIALGDANGANIIPVALVASKDNVTPTRKALNLVDNPDNKGKVVWVYGDVMKYFTVAGVKNTSDYSWDGVTTDIKAVTSVKNNAMFNLAGQPINAPKGIVIVNGKKMFVK